MPPESTYSAVLPQGKALLLLTDPRTTDAAAGGAEATGGVGIVFLAVGVVLVATGLPTARPNYRSRGWCPGLFLFRAGTGDGHITSAFPDGQHAGR